MTGDITVLVVDDHTLFRESLVKQIEKELDITVVGTASNGDEAMEQALNCKPDVILMDIDMPGMLCFDAARQIRARLPDTRIVFVSSFFNDSYIEQALRIEANGYLTKMEPLDVLFLAIRKAASDGVYFSDDVKSRIVFGSDGATLRHKPTSRLSTLSPRELEVLRYIARGLPKKDIARVMHVSHKTVDNHTSRLMNKLAIHSRVELTRYAIREGLAEA